MIAQRKSMKMSLLVVMILALLFPFFPSSLLTSTAAAAPIIVDGNPADWEEVPAIAVNSGNARGLKATHDDTNLYLLVEGSNLSTVMGSFWLNTDRDASTGYQAFGWGATGIEWLLENNSLYRYAGNGSSWEWTLWNYPSPLPLSLVLHP
ncbi:hypothetical protein ABDI30_15405 [Paenibacillus cisolokensis]|uniref:hypothetical protein n=1 Tax=Paenibacillus cisolokensis TaxID=1658519 RepID=UPI003D2E6C11